MKTSIIKTVAGLALAGLFASCSPSSNQESQNFQGSALSTNIIGGVNSSSEYQKANGIVGVLMVFKNEAGEQMAAGCTSTLIAKNVLLTAAHCLVAPEGAQLVAALVYFGTDQSVVFDEIANNDRSHVRAIDKIIRHEEYMQGTTADNDVGLIHFAGDMPEGFQIATRANSSIAALIKVGTNFTLAGFGVTNYKKDPTTGDMAGEGDGLLRQTDNMTVLSMTAEEITLDQTKGHGACHGDSGGPAFLVDPTTQKNILVGVTSRGTNEEGLCDEEVIYSAVAGYEKWIDAGLAKWAAQ